MNIIKIPQITHSFSVAIPLVSSKSESNRALIINALAGGFPAQLQNLSAARDTQTMLRLLASDEPVADVLDAGTTMRFLTAYFAMAGKTKTMTGTARMCERPIGILVEALRALGADIEYLKNEGYPPLQLNGFQHNSNKYLTMRGDVSSQFISAILMIAPTLPDGLIIQLTGEVGSIPYITMTLQLMAEFGVQTKADWANNIITIPPQKYEPQSFSVESDWSGASYWFSVMALTPFEDASLTLLGLKPQSLQGDAVIVEIMSHLGVKTVFHEKGLTLTKIPAETSLTWDFSNCPDIAQTVAVVCAAKQISLTLTGIESLKVKETDRVLALQNELKKIGANLVEVEKNQRYELTNTDFHTLQMPIKTYDDHRMAMAFAPLAMLMDVSIEDPEVVNKSYPSFWEDFKLLR